MPCIPKKTLREVKASGNHAVVQVKDNQKQLFEDCLLTIANETPVDTFLSEKECGHGRIEQRRVRVFENLGNTDEAWEPLICQIIEVHRITERKKTKTKSWEESTETAVYVCTTTRTAKEYHHIIRGHWGIENTNHYIRDNALLEDASRIRKNPGCMARIRSFALNILQANNVGNIRNTLFENNMEFNNIKKLRNSPAC